MKMVPNKNENLHWKSVLTNVKGRSSSSPHHHLGSPHQMQPKIDRKRASFELERLQMPESSGGGNKRCVRCYKRWSLDSGGWGKRGKRGNQEQSWGETVRLGSNRNLDGILRTKVHSELEQRKWAETESILRAGLFWAMGFMFDKQDGGKEEGKPLSEINVRDLEKERKRALPPLDKSWLSKLERNDPAKDETDLVFVVPLTSRRGQCLFFLRMQCFPILNNSICVQCF